MNVLWKCCKRTLKENRNRTIVTILGVALATGLITAAACLGFSLIASYTDYVKLTDGDAHAIFSGVAGKDLKRFFNNQSIDQTWIAKREGYVAVEESKYTNVKNFIEVSAVDEEWFSHHNNGILLADGRLPKTENEIVLDRRIHNEWGMDVKAWEFAYRIPWMESILCLLIVGVVLGVITERHLGRLVRKNVVEILRNENL